MRLSPARSLAATLTVLVFALAACGSDKDKKYDKYKASPSTASGSAPAAGAPRPADPAPAPAPVPVPPPKAEDEPAPTAAGALPPPSTAIPRVCNEYREVVQRLSQCGDALPKETQEAFKAQFDNQWAGWHKLPDKDRSVLAAVCERAAASVKAAASKPCGW